MLSVRLRVIVTALVLGVSCLPTSPAAPVYAAGLCGAATGTSDKVFVDKDSSELPSNFDLGRGDATVGSMNPCVGGAAFPYAQGSWILLANLEDSDASPVEIMQAGYGKGCSFCADDFIYTPAADGSGAAWPGSLTPVNGHRVRFKIQRVSTSSGIKAKYTLTDVTTNQTEIFNATWKAGITKAWWGAEALDTSSEVGVDYAGNDSNVAYMGYSVLDNGSILYRSDMEFDACYCEDAPGAGPSDVEKQGGRNSTEHGHLGTWVFGNDMVNFESH